MVNTFVTRTFFRSSLNLFWRKKKITPEATSPSEIALNFNFRNGNSLDQKTWLIFGFYTSKTEAKLSFELADLYPQHKCKWLAWGGGETNLTCFPESCCEWHAGLAAQNSKPNCRSSPQKNPNNPPCLSAVVSIWSSFCLGVWGPHSFWDKGNKFLLQLCISALPR